jgi:muramoyltetrapeptide carboxypeptidase
MPRVARPPRLSPGGQIRVVAPAGRVQRERLLASTAWFRARGYRVSWGRHLGRGYGYFDASDGERAADFNEALHDPDVDAIFAARGGYGSMRILPLIDWAYWARHPRIFLGYSDCTAILAGLLRYGRQVGFHGPVMESTGWAGPNADWCLRWLSGDAGWLHPMPMTLVNGRAGDGLTGHLIGGNLTLVAALLGTPWAWPIGPNAILYLEEVSEAPYRVDRLLSQLALAGVLDRVGAVIFGQAWQCTGPADRPGFTVDQVIAEHLSRLKVPAYVHVPSGHGPFQVTLPMGAAVLLEKGRLRLTEPAVA